MMKVAKSAAGEAGIPNAEFRLGDARNIPAQDHSVDVVISNCVVGIFPDKEKVFAEVHRVLKPGGYLVAIDTIYSRKVPNLLMKLHRRIRLPHCDDVRERIYVEMMGYRI